MFLSSQHQQKLVQFWTLHFQLEVEHVVLMVSHVTEKGEHAVLETEDGKMVKEWMEDGTVGR